MWHKYLITISNCFPTKINPKNTLADTFCVKTKKKKNLLIFNKTRVFKYLKSKFLNENEKKNFFQFMFITLLYKNDLDCMNT